MSRIIYNITISLSDPQPPFPFLFTLFIFFSCCVVTKLMNERQHCHRHLILRFPNKRRRQGGRGMGRGGGLSWLTEHQLLIKKKKKKWLSLPKISLLGLCQIDKGEKIEKIVLKSKCHFKKLQLMRLYLPSVTQQQRYHQRNPSFLSPTPSSGGGGLSYYHGICFLSPSLLQSTALHQPASSLPHAGIRPRKLYFVKSWKATQDIFFSFFFDNIITKNIFVPAGYGRNPRRNTSNTPTRVRARVYG